MKYNLNKKNSFSKVIKYVTISGLLAGSIIAVKSCNYMNQYVTGGALRSINDYSKDELQKLEPLRKLLTNSDNAVKKDNYLMNKNEKQE